MCTSARLVSSEAGSSSTAHQTISFFYWGEDVCQILVWNKFRVAICFVKMNTGRCNTSTLVVWGRFRFLGQHTTDYSTTNIIRETSIALAMLGTLDFPLVTFARVANPKSAYSFVLLEWLACFMDLCGFRLTFSFIPLINLAPTYSLTRNLSSLKPADILFEVSTLSFSMNSVRFSSQHGMLRHPTLFPLKQRTHTLSKDDETEEYFSLSSRSTEMFLQDSTHSSDKLAFSPRTSSTLTNSMAS